VSNTLDKNRYRKREKDRERKREKGKGKREKGKGKREKGKGNKEFNCALQDLINKTNGGGKRQEIKIKIKKRTDT
jgi:hypothetical protein